MPRTFVWHPSKGPATTAPNRFKDGDRVVLTELQIALYGAIDETSDLGELIRAARPIGSNAGQCPRVVIDKAGL